MSSGVLKKIFSIISVIRGHNILVLITAQYLASIFIFSGSKSIKLVLLDKNLFFLILATVCTVAAGYIINNFYDIKTDFINRPVKTNIDNLVDLKTQLYLYFFFNTLGFFFSCLVSWRAAMFFVAYIFCIWFYSHKLKKYPLVGLITATILTILPFFIVFIYYKNFSKVIFIHAFFLLLIIMIRELIKDLEKIKGDFVNNYNTFPVVYGEKKTKKIIVLLIFLTLIPVVILYNYPSIENMKYYFYLSGFVLFFIALYLREVSKKNQYIFLHNILKILLLVGVFSMILIDKTLLLDKVMHILD